MDMDAALYTFITEEPSSPEDAARQAAMLVTLPPAFSSDRISFSRRFLAEMVRSGYGAASDIHPFIRKTLQEICTESNVSFDINACKLLESTLDIAACVLAGGQSRRMGRDKRGLTFRENTFLETALRSVELYADRYLSVGPAEAPDHDPGLVILQDKDHGQGPVSGIAEALQATRSPWILFIPCDMPLLTADLLDELALRRKPGQNAWIFTEKGEARIFPLFLRTKAAAPVFAKALAKGECKLKTIIEEYLHPETLEVTDCFAYRDHILSNINTADDYLYLGQSNTPQRHLL